MGEPVNGIISGISAALSARDGRRERKAVKRQNQAAAAEVERQKKLALEDRRIQIDAQREQLAGIIGGYNTNPTGQTGAAKLKKNAAQDKETLG